jgi:hypothetical protein
VADRIRKRRFYPVEIAGEKVHIRGMKHSERNTAEAFRDHDESVGFAIGCCLLNDDGSEVFTRAAEESPKDFGGRVLKELDLPDDTKAELIQKIVKLSSGPPELEKIVKN